MRGPDAGTMLVRALTAAAGQAGCAVDVVGAEWEAWASATVSGARHAILLACADTAFADWIASLPEFEFTLRGHLVADIAIDSVRWEGDRCHATIAALTLIET